MASSAVSFVSRQIRSMLGKGIESGQRGNKCKRCSASSSCCGSPLTEAQRKKITAGNILRFTSLLSRGMEVNFRKMGTKERLEQHILHINDRCSALMISSRERRTSLCVPMKCVVSIKRMKGSEKCLVVRTNAKGNRMLELGFWCEETRNQMALLLGALVDYSTLDDWQQSAQSKPSDGDDGEQCGICVDAPLDGVCFPCGHQAGCYSCLKVIQSSSGKCPLCRAVIEEVHLASKTGPKARKAGDSPR